MPRRGHVSSHGHRLPHAKSVADPRAGRRRPPGQPPHHPARQEGPLQLRRRVRPRRARLLPRLRPSSSSPSARRCPPRTQASAPPRADAAAWIKPARSVPVDPSSSATFDGDALDVEPLDRVAADVHIVVADLEASKDNVVILRDLQPATVARSDVDRRPSRTRTHVGVRVRRLLGETNQKFVREATEAIARGDAAALGRTYADAQAAFERRRPRGSGVSVATLGAGVASARAPTTTSEPHRLGGKAWVVRGTGRCSSCADLGRLGGGARRRCGGNS